MAREPIDPQRREAMQKASDAQFQAAEEATRAMLNLWRSRVNFAMEMDDEAAVRDVLSRPGGEVGLWDNNTNCGSGCGGGGGTSHWA